MPHADSPLVFHLTWTTRNREPCLDLAVIPALLKVCGAVLYSRGGVLLAATGGADHLRLLVQLPARPSKAKIVESVQRCTVRWLHQRGHVADSFAWDDTYHASLVPAEEVGRMKRLLCTRKGKAAGSWVRGKKRKA